MILDKEINSSKWFLLYIFVHSGHEDSLVPDETHPTDTTRHDKTRQDTTRHEMTTLLCHGCSQYVPKAGSLQALSIVVICLN